MTARSSLHKETIEKPQNIAAALAVEATPPRTLRGHEERKKVYLPVSRATFERVSMAKNLPEVCSLM